MKQFSDWKLDQIAKGQTFTYVWDNENELRESDGPARDYLQYLKNFEIDNLLRSEFGKGALSIPMVYLPVYRSANSFPTNINLSDYDDFEQKRAVDATVSRGATQIVTLAVNRLAQKYRLLQENDNTDAKTAFQSDESIKQLTSMLGGLGYGWELVTINPLRNEYVIRLKKQGGSFAVSAASSGERELLTYVFAIFALNVRDALIVVDEPELHLHPKWQKTLLSLFRDLSSSTGNQFLCATHSPTFISPDSIEYVSRVFSGNQQSHILKLAGSSLPSAKHQLQIVNSQNNERIFFADEVVLVEGISDRFFFEAVLDKFGRPKYSKIIEVIDVGGKGFFNAYSKLLSACQIPYSIIADRDYIEQIGSNEIKALFTIDESEIKDDVIDNIKSLDGKAIFEALEQALETGDLTELATLWAYEKSRRIKLKPNLNRDQQQQLDEFISGKRKENIFVLKYGTLENYLPRGLRRKDLEKLIPFVGILTFGPNLNNRCVPNSNKLQKLSCPYP